MTIRVAIVGYGQVSSAHIEAFNDIPGVLVTDLYSSHLCSPEAEIVTNHYNVTLHADLEKMLSDPAITIVSICSRPDLHLRHALAAIKAGKHIVLEKPIGLNFEECLSIQKAVEQAGVYISVCFECRYSDQFLKTKAIVDSQLGAVTYCSIQYCHGIGPDNPQFSWNTKRSAGGSSLLSAGCHALDAALFLMGDREVEEVMSYASTISHERFAPYEYPPHQVSILKLKKGGIVEVFSSIACTQPYDFPTYIVGTKGTLKDDLYYTLEHKQEGKSEWQSIPMTLLRSGAVNDHPYRVQFAEFIDDITLDRRAASLRKFAAALETHRIIFAADLSAEEGRPVSLHHSLV